MNYCETGLIRPVDEFGRIALPKKIRDALEVKCEYKLEEQDSVEFLIDNSTGYVIIRKAEKKERME